jgi:hypothetical protein
LKLIWEVTEKTEKVFSKFQQFSNLGEEVFIERSISDRKFRIYMLKIFKENIEVFKDKVKGLK